MFLEVLFKILKKFHLKFHTCKARKNINNKVPPYISCIIIYWASPFVFLNVPNGLCKESAEQRVEMVLNRSSC